MTDKMPVVKGKELLIFYIKIGCELKRVKGSHHVLKSKFNGNIFVIPVHSNEDLDRGTLKSIIIQSGLSFDEFLEYWKQI